MEMLWHSTLHLLPCYFVGVIIAYIMIKWADVHLGGETEPDWYDVKQRLKLSLLSFVAVVIILISILYSYYDSTDNKFKNWANKIILVFKNSKPPKWL